MPEFPKLKNIFYEKSLKHSKQVNLSSFETRRPLFDPRTVLDGGKKKSSSPESGNLQKVNRFVF